MGNIKNMGGWEVKRVKKEEWGLVYCKTETLGTKWCTIYGL